MNIAVAALFAFVVLAIGGAATLLFLAFLAHVRD